MIVSPSNKQEQDDERTLYDNKQVLTMNHILATNNIFNGSECDVKNEFAQVIANTGLNHLETYKVSHFSQP